MSTGAKNKRTGSNAEKEFARMLGKALNLSVFDNKNVKEKDAQVGTSRQFSRNLDGRKIDIWFRDDVPSLIRKLAFQIKKKVAKKGSAPVDARVVGQIQVQQDQVPVLVSHFRHKSPAGLEMAGPWFVTMRAEDFLELLKNLKDENAL